MNQNEWHDEILKILHDSGTNITTEEKSLLLAPTIPITDEKKALYAKLIPALFNEIFLRGQKGQTFGSENRLIPRVLDNPIGETYAGGSKIFIDITRSFLTLWSEYLDIHTTDSVLQNALNLAVRTHKEAFFPGAIFENRVPASLFKSKQHDYLKGRLTAAEIEEYFDGNPMLDHSGNPLAGSGRSCLVLLIGATGILTSMAVSVMMLL
jgi:hypothetical protein